MKRLAALLACGALTMPALAEDTVKDSFKKVEKDGKKTDKGKEERK